MLKKISHFIKKAYGGAKEVIVPIHKPARGKIDIDSLGFEDLMDLNHRIVERVKYLSDSNLKTRMSKFRIGDRVSFDAEGCNVKGTVLKINRKTITVETQEAVWNIPPRFLNHLNGV